MVTETVARDPRSTNCFACILLFRVSERVAPSNKNGAKSSFIPDPEIALKAAVSRSACSEVLAVCSEELDAWLGACGAEVGT